MRKAEASLIEVADALGFLDSSDRDLWIRMGMAIKTEFGEAGFSVWDRWSQGCAEYSSHETTNQWRSFKSVGVRGTVTLGSLFHVAQQQGYRFVSSEPCTQLETVGMKDAEARRNIRAAKDAEIASDLAIQERWHRVVAEASNRIVSHLTPVGKSPYLGLKKVGAFGIYFVPQSMVIVTRHNFTIDLLLGADSVRHFFESKKKEMSFDLNSSESFVFFKRGSILVPLRDRESQLHNLQIIFNEGQKKRFLHHGRKSGLFHQLGSLLADKPIVFCEGYATGASLHMATGWPVVVCFDAGNLPVVAAQFADCVQPKIIAGDNDAAANRNVGLLKAQEAAKASGGLWCIPHFSSEVTDVSDLSDFNDLHQQEGLAVVKAQVEKVVQASTGSVNAVEAVDTASLIPATLSGLLERYGLTVPDAKVWDYREKQLISVVAFRKIVRSTLYRQWLDHPERRTLRRSDAEPQLAAAQKQGFGELGEALNRYVYLSPSDAVWDKREREVVPLAHLKYAIADCFNLWVTHSEREQIPLRHLVFDPTDTVDTTTHINQFRGLVLQPVRDDKRCERIVMMLMALCNNDTQVFRWLRRWLAYPLKNPGAKMETAVLCHSEVHGSGKSYFFDVVMRAIYGEYSRTVGQAQLESQYNDWMSKVLYCVYEEVLSRAQKFAHQGTIKQTITGKTVRIEKKFMSGWEEANHMNSVFLSNEVLPLPVEPSDRRFLVIWPEQKLYEHLQRGVDEDLRQGGAAAFYYFLLDTRLQEIDEDYPFDEHTKPPMTEAKERLIDHGRPIWEVFYGEWALGSLRCGEQPVPYTSIRVAQLFRYFCLWCQENKEHSMGLHKFTSFLSSKLKRRKDLEYEGILEKGRATFFIVEEPPKTTSQKVWLGQCVEAHQQILDKCSQSERKVA
jgi:putative DNA primase/helicase